MPHHSNVDVERDIAVHLGQHDCSRVGTRALHPADRYVGSRNPETLDVCCIAEECLWDLGGSQSFRPASPPSLRSCRTDEKLVARFRLGLILLPVSSGARAGRTFRRNHLAGTGGPRPGPCLTARRADSRVSTFPPPSMKPYVRGEGRSVCIRALRACTVISSP